MKYIKTKLKKLYKKVSPYKFAIKNSCEIEFDFAADKKALLSYIQAPFAFKDQQHCKATHANYAAAWEIVYILRDLGFNVDVVEASNKQFIPNKDYDIVIGTLDCIDRFKPFLPSSCICIFYALGVYVDARNGPNGELGRIADLEKRTGMYYTPKRLFGNPESIRRSIEIADHVIITGGLSTYETFPERIRVSKSTMCTMPIYPETIPPEIAVPIEERMEFLWFFGYGQVHKGLDLVIEAFVEMPHLRLNIVGNMEPDFEKIYGDIIKNARNIKCHGYLNTQSEQFNKVISKCFAFVAPTVNEGISCACVTSIQLGLYPIMTRETGVDLPEGLGVNIDLCSKESLKKKIMYVNNYDKEKLQAELKKMRNWTIEKYSPDTFVMQFSSIVRNVIKSGS